MAIRRLLSIIIFSATIATPSLLLLGGIDGPVVNIKERRTLASMPSWKDLSPDSFEKYFNDNIPLRTPIIASYMRIWEAGLSSFVRSAVKGKDEHFFPNIAQAPVFERALGMHPLAPHEVDRLRTVLLGRQAYWQSKGAEYFFLLAPDKTTLCPEYLPDWVKETRGFYHQVIGALKNSDLRLIDMQPVLVAHSNGPYYNKRYDIVHWNGNALKIAYEEILRNSKLLQDPPLTSFKITPATHKAPPFEQEIVPWLKINRQGLVVAKPASLRPNWRDATYVTSSNDNGLSMLFLSDSYFKSTHQDRLPKINAAISPLVHSVQHYAHGHIQEPFKQLDVLAQETRPDIVVESFVERGINHFARKKYDQRLLIAGEQLSGNSFTPFTPGLIHKSTNLDYSIVGDSIQGTIHDPKANLFFSPQQANENGRYAFFAQFYSPMPGAVQLFFAKEGEPFSKKKAVAQQVQAGLNYLYFCIYDSPGARLKVRLNAQLPRTTFTLSPVPSLKRMFSDVTVATNKPAKAAQPEGIKQESARTSETAPVPPDHSTNPQGSDSRIAEQLPG